MATNIVATIMNKLYKWSPLRALAKMSQILDQDIMDIF
jgi:hypothetical protein